MAAASKKRVLGLRRRKNSVRGSIRANSDRIRLSVHRSGRNLYAQLIDDVQGKTLASANTLEKELSKTKNDVSGAASVGKLVAERGLKAGVKQVVFDRGSFAYHGKVKALAEAAREAGLDF